MGIKKLLTVAALLAAGGLTHSAWAQTDVTSTYLTNADFETSPIFDGTSLGSSETNATATTGSTLVEGAVNSYEINGWTNMSTDKSDFVRVFTMPYNTTLYVKSNGANGGQAVAAPANGSSVTENNSSLLFVEANWAGQATLGIKKDVTLPAGIYELKFDSYVTTNLNNGTSLCGVKIGSTTMYKWPTALNTWTNNSISFVLTSEQNVTVSMGYLKNNNVGGGTSPFLFVDNVQLFKKSFDEVTESSPVDLTSMAEGNWLNASGATAGTTASSACGGLTGVSEAYQWADCLPTGNTLNKTIANLPSGIYEIEVYCASSSTSGRDNTNYPVTDGDEQYVTLTVNGENQAIPTYNRESVDPVLSYTFSNIKVTEGTLNMSVNINAVSPNWLMAKVKSVTYLGPDLEVAKASLNTAIGKAEDIDQSKLNTGVKTLLTNALSTANTSYNSGTLKEIIDADNNLNSVITIANNIQEPYAKFNAYKAIATNSEETEAGAKETYNGVISANEATIEAATTVSEIETVLSVIETARQAYIVKAVPTNGTTFDYTFFVKNATFNGSSDGWIIGGKKTNNGDYRLNNVQGKTCWNSWNNKFESMDIHQDITNLPDGKYKVTCKAITEVNRITDQHAYAQTTSGKVVSPNMTIANFTSPEGWESLETAEAIVIDGKLTIGFESTSTGEQNGWFCVTDFELAYVSAVSDSEYATIAKENLLAIINTANGLNTTINVGTGVFQIPTSAVNTITSAISDAQEVYNNDEATKSAVEEACIALESAIEAYENVELNAPAENTRYNVVLNFEGWDYDNKAITFIAGGRNDAGLYNIQYLVDPNPNYAQAIIFTKAEGANRYTMSIMDVDGNQRYICTGVPYSGNTSQIRTTTDASKALVVEIRVTNVEGNLNIFNTEANNYIGSQDNGVYTVNSHIDFNIVEAVEAEVTLNISAGKYATRIFPFAAEIPAGVTVYSCATIEGQTLILSEEDAIAPNVPYILYSEEGVETTLTGYGTAKQDSYTAGLLTGVYGTGTVPAGSYVLQTQEGVQGFYKVAETAVDYVSYRAYLTVPSANAKAFFFGGDATVINGVEGAEGATEVVRFNAAGVQVAAPVKGLNIVKMSDGTVKKVMVK